MVRMNMGVKKDIRILIGDPSLKHLPQCPGSAVDQYNEVLSENG